MKKNNWYVITGAPCSGKSTMLKLLKQKGYDTVDEAARMYLDREIVKGRKLEDIRKDELEFQKNILKLKIKIEKTLQQDKLIILERGIPDSLAYYKLCGVDNDDYLEKCIGNCSYKKVFLLELLEYKKDYARTEDYLQAKELEILLEKSYRDSNFEVIKVPKMENNKRILYILRHLN